MSGPADFKVSWLVQLADCISVLPLAALMTPGDISNATADMAKLVWVLNDGRGGVSAN